VTARDLDDVVREAFVIAHELGDELANAQIEKPVLVMPIITALVARALGAGRNQQVPLRVALSVVAVDRQ
jgi:hypothetical protein